MTPRTKRPDAVVNPPREGAKPGRPGLPPVVASRVRELMEELLVREPYAGRGAISRLAEALNISQPAVSQIRGGGGVAPETAIAVAKLAGVDPRELLGGAFVGVAVGGKFPNLEICLAYHRDRWTTPTVAVARAGLWTSDADPEAWAKRLDEAQKLLAGLSDDVHPLGGMRSRARS